MINLDDYDKFKNNKQLLKELSKDTDNNEYMTESKIQAVDFDEVKNLYERELNLHGKPRASSVDAISHTKDSIVFIEFKNGDMHNQKVKVREKIRDSLLVFGAISNKTISYTRQKVEFILVYNETRNPLPNQYTKGVVQPSESCRFISKRLAQLGKSEFVLYGLEVFKGLYFRDVHTYSQEEFEEYALNLIE